MSKLNSIEKSTYIKDKYKEYLRSSFEFGSKKLQNLFEKQLDDGELFKGPYVNLNLPFQRGKNINELIEEGIVCKSFKRLENINFERPLYSHQEESIRKICAGKSVVITTGTGSGKTESFLYSILNDLMLDIEKGNREIGIRALFLYPMNALLNDQMDRVRQILTTCPDITYGFYTGDTKEKVSDDDRKKYGEANNTIIPKNELVSREEIRNTPPHLLFTNYSMLEFLLIRPDDYSIFIPEKLKNWRYVVLDEAHSYQGAKGIEISLLMRRLTGLAPRKPRFILSSATLGQQGKSEDAIIHFAESLTSVSFSAEDIIFAKRIPLKEEPLSCSVNGEDYTKLKANLKDFDTVKQIALKYNCSCNSSIKDILYELLISDKNVFEIYQALKDNCKDFKKLLDIFSGRLTEKQLIDVIDLINFAEKNGIGIFDLKYHSFVRPLSGAYITMEKEPELSLTKTNKIGNLKAFEIGNCKYCGTTYAIGKILPCDTDNLDHLFQDEEVDIYENYGDNKAASLDYFLFENAINEEEINDNILEEYKICIKCGSIYFAENLNAKKCSCGDSFQRSIFKVVQQSDKECEMAFNNINQCPCCGRRSNNGVVKKLDLGKDAGTALIAQTLLEAIDEEDTKIKKSGKLSLKIPSKTDIDTPPAKIKQFLTFSDSRQQASFAAVFMDAVQARMLRKRLIWKVIENHNYQNIPVNELASELTSIIKERELFSSKLGAHKNAWIAIMVDLLKVDGAYDGEGLGLYHFDIDLSNLMNQIDENEVREEFGQFKITKSDLETIMQVVFGVFKTTPAINYVKSTLTPKEKLDALEYRRFDNYIMYNCPRNQEKNFHSFLPVNGRDNKVVRYIQKIAGCNEEKAKSILSILFIRLGKDGDLFKKHESKEAYQIDAGSYIVKNYKTSKYYKCSKCGRLTPYNVHNVCVQDKCNGTLSEIDPDIALGANYYRIQYKTKKIERIVIEEHTAQIDKEEAKQYQQDFKDGKINILSCSTTFEMGIDIGNLETVFMRNVPPTPANYVQRAGRAGRRKDSAAYILTYCEMKSHDYTYFCKPEEMISGIINPPYLNAVNHKIILRHVMAAYLGFFFRQYPDCFKNIKEFVGGMNKFKEYIENRPEDLNTYINEKVLPENTYADYHNFNCWNKIIEKNGKMQYFVDSIKAITKEYEDAKNDAIKNEEYSDADYYKKQRENLLKERVIDNLSRYCVIPRYGFPVDVVELQVYDEKGRLDIDKKPDLKRDLKIAIAEYAPDSEVIVDKDKYTSQYITLPKTSSFPKYYFSTCQECQKVNVFLSTKNRTKCKYCGKPIVLTKGKEFYIDPIYGFKAGETKESTRMKPKRSYAGEILYLGGGEKDEKDLKIGEVVTIETSTNDELLVMNRSHFYMCPECGYCEINARRFPVPITKEHRNFHQRKCNCKDLEHIKLGHKFQTDVAKFSIPMLKKVEKEDFAKALSFMYAMLEGISKSLEIERADIDGIIDPNSEQYRYDILIYDNVPGGAGHVKRIVNKQTVVNILKAAREKVTQQCCEENTSCYNCLRNYYNQAYHSKLQRKFAKDIIEALLREIDK